MAGELKIELAWDPWLAGFGEDLPRPYGFGWLRVAGGPPRFRVVHGPHGGDGDDREPAGSHPPEPGDAQRR